MLSARCLEWKADVDSPCACCVSSVCTEWRVFVQQFLGVFPQTVSVWCQVHFVYTEKQTPSRLSRVEWTEWIVTPRCDWMLFSEHFYSVVKWTLESGLKSWTKVTLCTLSDPEWLVEVSSARMLFCKQFESDAKAARWNRWRAEVGSPCARRVSPRNFKLSAVLEWFSPNSLSLMSKARWNDSWRVDVKLSNLKRSAVFECCSLLEPLQVNGNC